MPANPKYLTHSKWQRFAKISAGFLGGFMVSTSFHIALGIWFSPSYVVITGYFSLLLLWAGLMIVAFLSRNGWKLWGIYILITLLLAAVDHY